MLASVVFANAGALSGLVAGALTLQPAPAQAGLFDLILQPGQNQTQQAQQRQEAARLRAQQRQEGGAPAKVWGPAVPVPAPLQQAGDDFARQSNDPDLQPLLSRLVIEGERNAVLNLQRIGLAALSKGQIDLAGRAFDAALSRVERIYADNPDAQKAKSLWSKESVKDFKGEPYERAMAYFYRGLVYAAGNDFQNARAMFKQADYQDSVAETERFGSDFGLMPFMAGWASYCDGDTPLAKDYLQQAAKGDSTYEHVVVTTPVLVLYEAGQVPMKYGGGKHAELLKWRKRDVPAPAVTGVCPEQGACVTDGIVLGADVAYQATTRGGRPVDSVLEGKAAYKDGTQTAANVAAVVGQTSMRMAAQTGNRDAANVGIVASLLSLAANAVAGAMTPAADVREWEQLPQSIWLAPITAPPKSDKLAVRLAGQKETHALVRLVNTKACKLYWGRLLDPLATMGELGPLEPGQHTGDAQFREEMVGLLPGTVEAGK